MPTGQFANENMVRQLGGIGFICRVVSVNAASMAAGASGVGTVAIAGITPEHRIFVGTQGALSGAVVPTGGRVLAPGTLTVDFVNPTAGVIDAAPVSVAVLGIPGDIGGTGA